MSENPGAEFFATQDERLAKAVRGPYTPEPPRRDPYDAQRAYYAFLEEETRAGRTEEEATLLWAEWAYNLGRHESTGESIRAMHLAGLKHLWEMASDVARADAIDEQPYSE